MLFDDLTQKVNKGRMTELRWLLWAALQAKHAHRFETPEDVCPLIDKAGRLVVQTALSHMLALNQDDDPPKADGKDAPKDERPGSIWRRMYLDAREMGVPEQVFWTLSLRELWLELAIGRQRRKYDSDRIKTQAWWTSVLVWQGFAGKTPELATLLNRTADPKPERRQPWQEMKAMFTWIATADQKTPVKAVKGQKASG